MAGRWGVSGAACPIFSPLPPLYCVGKGPDGLQVRYVQQAISGCPLAATFLREKRDQSIVPSGTPLLAKNYPHHRLPRLFWLGWTSNWRKVFLLLCCQQFPSLLKGRMFISGHEQSPQVFSDFFSCLLPNANTHCAPLLVPSGVSLPFQAQVRG
ncbi:hypothetical protein BJ166DRAFT_168736 [Pestalotiopsis sp. NC0098]|nr:hypothetical protein BJ166DRAFT_168736 [Pestalotiopsis sp. NC0098]